MARAEAGPPPVATSAVARREVTEPKYIMVYREIAQTFQREDRRAELRAMLGGDDELVARFLSVAMHALSSDSDLLLNATPLSIIQAIKDSAALGLEPTGLNGEGWIIRYGKQAVFQPGWRGYLKRIRNSHAVTDIDVQLIYENDEFDYGWSEKGGWFTHHPARLRKNEDQHWVGRGDYWGAIAYAVMPSGFVEMDVMPTVDINTVRDTFSQAAMSDKKSPWDTSWGEMARKTVLRRLAKRLPQAAVDKLLEAEARAEAAIEAENSGPRIDVSAARQAALAAAGGSAQLTAGTVTAGVTPPDEEPASAEPEPDGSVAPVGVEGFVGPDGLYREPGYVVEDATVVEPGDEPTGEVVEDDLWHER